MLLGAPSISFPRGPRCGHDPNRICQQHRAPDPTYRQVCTGRTDAAETVRVVYNPDSVSLPFLLDLFYKTIDPTSVDRQGNDVGSQYRTGIFYTDKSDLPVIEKSIKELSLRYTEPIAIEVDELKTSILPKIIIRTILTRIPEAIATSIRLFSKSPEKPATLPQSVFGRATASPATKSYETVFPACNTT